MKKYKHLFFDLDHTLWDYENNSRDTLTDLYATFELNKFNKFSVHIFLDKFEEINNHLWQLFNQGKIDKDYIRSERFAKIFEALGLQKKDVPDSFGDLYLSFCPAKSKVIPFAYEILDYLKDRYQLHIITNGFNDIQMTKLNSSRLTPYFTVVVDSDSTGFKKPQKEIFLHAMEKTKASIEDCIMIGDNLLTDILGAKNAAMDQVYFNPNAQLHQVDVTYEVSSLQELKQIF